jgi:hypothetical protein
MQGQKLIQTDLDKNTVQELEILVHSGSRPEVMHKVTRNLAGRWACSCEAFRYAKHHTHPEDDCVDGEKACYHIRYVRQKEGMQ